MVAKAGDVITAVVVLTLALAIGPVFAQSNAAGIDPKNFDANTSACSE